MIERWLPVVDFEELYEVSDRGRVRSFPRATRVRGNGRRILASRFLRPYPMKKCGHLAIDLIRSDGTRRRTRVHILVLEAFVGPRPARCVGRHWDGNVNNNHVSNLLWGTHSDNMYDMVRQRRHPGVNKTHCPKGHLLDGVWKHNGRRYCTTCKRRWNREYKHRMAQ